MTYRISGQDNLSAKEFVTVLLELAAQRVNDGVSKTLTGRKTTEIPPKSARHLTDTRTRVSTLLEYSVAYEMNRILEADEAGYSVSAVLWNVFPDLLIRDAAKNKALGLEVKALHTAAEEKSANLATPIQLINSGKDFVVIINWGWQVQQLDGVSMTYPHIHMCGVFDAWLLAKIRDYGWLYKQGGRVKAIDIATPVINGKGALFKAEEGNMGKLMRISLPNDMPTSVPHYTEMLAEANLFSTFQDRVLALGLRETFFDLCLLEGALAPQIDGGENYPTACRVLGQCALPNGTDFRLIAGPRPELWLNLNTHGLPDASVVLWLSQKLDWRIFRREDVSWRVIGSGQKPDSDLDTIQRLVRNDQPPANIAASI